jgi:hypothetical protein
VTGRLDPLIGRALASCVTQEAGADLEEVIRLGRLDQLIEAGRSHRVLNLVYLATDGLVDPDDPSAAGLKRYHIHHVGHHLRALEDLAGIVRVLGDRGIDWIVVKGPVLSEVVYERPDLRVYKDLDVVIRGDAFAEAIDAFEAAGSELLDRNWALIRREGRAQLHVVLRLGTIADVHRHLLNRAVVRNSFMIPMEDLFARARSVAIGHVVVRTLDPVDTLLHLCIHGGLAGGHQLLWLKDIDTSVRREPPRWDELVDRAHGWRAASIVALMLRRARATLGTAVPPDVFEALFGRTGRARVSGLIDRRWPTETAGIAVTPAILWAQVVRDSWAGTALALARRLERSLVNAVQGQERQDEPGRHSHAETPPS